MGGACSSCNVKQGYENMTRASTTDEDDSKAAKKPKKNTHKTMELALQQLLNWKQTWGDGVCAMIVLQNNTDMYLNLDQYNLQMEGIPYQECRVFSHHIAPRKFWAFLHVKNDYVPQGCEGWLAWNINKHKHNKNRDNEHGYGSYYCTIGWSAAWPFGSGNGLNIICSDKAEILDSDDFHDTNVIAHNDHETGFTVQASCLTISSSIFMYKISHAHDIPMSSS